MRADDALALEKRRQLGQGIAAVGRGRFGGVDDAGGHDGQSLELDIEVAHDAEQAGQPPELFPEDLGPDREYAFEEGQGGPQTSRGDAHVMQFLRILAEPRPGLFGL